MVFITFMSRHIVCDNKKSTPIPIIISTLLLGLSSPVVSVLFWRLYLHETNDMLSAYAGLFMAVFWPLAWIPAMFLAALNPLFGKTSITIIKDDIEVRKTLFSVCWKCFQCKNDRDVNLSILQRTTQSPTHSSANQMRKGTTTCTYWQLVLRSGKRQCHIHESYNERDEVELLNHIRQAIAQEHHP